MQKRQKRENKSFLTRLLSLVVVVLLIATAAVVRDGKLFGHEWSNPQASQAAAADGNDTLVVLPDGGFVVNTKPLAKDVMGYGGNVPLKISVSKDGVVDSIVAEPNAETPDFFDYAKTLFDRWKGKTVDEAMAQKVDAVTGATFSSKAIIGNMNRGLAYARQHVAAEEQDRASEATASAAGAFPDGGWTVGGIAAVVVVLLGAVVPLLTKSRRWRYVQLVLNVVVLGLCTGTFVSYALFMRLFSGGVSVAALSALAAPLLMVVVALVYPLVGKQGYYCANMCPFGSAQELAGKLSRRKLRMSPRLNKGLVMFKNVLWCVLMVLLLTGVWTAWTDYELFTAFLYSSASVWVIAAAVGFLVLSVWVPRPYCRFVCPTGCLIKPSLSWAKRKNTKGTKPTERN